MKPNNKNIVLSSLLKELEKRGSVVLLESQHYDHPAARKTYIAALPEATLWAKDDIVTYEGKNGTAKIKANPWKELALFYDNTDGWLFGYIGYDLKNSLENLHSRNTDLIEAPDLFMMNPGLIIEITRDGWGIIKGELPSDFETGKKAVDFLKYSSTGLKPGISEQAYCDIIREAKVHIREGDYYEINLSHQMQGAFKGNAFGLYNDMKEAGPVPFGAYLHFGDGIHEWSVCSASPERFLAKREERVYSQPIKGTIHRGRDEKEDDKLKKWLSSSSKNRAENLMIVDLVRNDLGRIARKGTVEVSNLFEVQSFDTVHQMVSTVEAQADTHHPVDIIKACFPMGSMTGAPKIRAMQSIEELENYRRGIYSGAIGYLTPNGDFDFNVVIRTAIIKGDRLFYSVGGAITSDSEPVSEWNETLTKAEALIRAISQADQEKIALSNW